MNPTALADAVNVASLPTPYYQDDAVTIYHGDCREILLTLPKHDLLLTDPPYGLNKSWGSSKGWQGKCGKGRLWNGTPEWDKEPAEVDFLPLSDRCIVWGGNYFANLDPQKGWLVWDKQAAMIQAQAELAWTNFVPTVRVFRLSPLGVFGNGGLNGEMKEHPTQKPLALFRWCLSFAPDAETILDPFAGSCTTGVAAKLEGRKATLIELEERYCEVGANRLSQGVLF
jgi:DNA modification methylase